MGERSVREARFEAGGSWDCQDFDQRIGMPLNSDSGGSELMYSFHNDSCRFRDSRMINIVNC